MEENNKFMLKKFDANDYLEDPSIDERLRHELQKPGDLRLKVSQWLSKQGDGNQFNSVKICRVELIDYESLDLDTITDEFELKQIRRKIAENQRACGHHIVCPMYRGGAVVAHSECILELMEAKRITASLMIELDVSEDDYNDKMMLDQIVSLSLINQRATRDLAAGNLIDDIKTYTKMGLKVETKINDNLLIIDKTQAQIDRLRKHLLLTREDKARFKQLKKQSEERTVNEQVKSKIKEAEEAFIVVDEVAEGIIENKENIIEKLEI